MKSKFYVLALMLFFSQFVVADRFSPGKIICAAEFSEEAKKKLSFGDSVSQKEQGRFVESINTAINNNSLVENCPMKEVTLPLEQYEKRQKEAFELSKSYCFSLCETEAKKIIGKNISQFDHSLRNTLTESLTQSCKNGCQENYIRQHATLSGYIEGAKFGQESCRGGAARPSRTPGVSR